MANEVGRKSKYNFGNFPLLLFVVSQSYEQVVGLLSTELLRSGNVQVLSPVTFEKCKSVDNYLIFLRRGNLAVSTEDQKIVLEPGDILFLPAGTLASITYGTSPTTVITDDKFIGAPNQYFYFIEQADYLQARESFSYINFRTSIFGGLNFFSFVGLPPFLVRDPHITSIVTLILEENRQGRVGKGAVLLHNTAYLVVLLLRYLIENKVHLPILAAKTDVLTDPQLGKLFKYISCNLHGDLSNKLLAKKTNLSEKYVGQFFKKAMKISLQEYVKSARLERALELLKHKDLKVQAISRAVGFKGFAYFCKEFKGSFGVPAKKVRRRICEG